MNNRRSKSSDGINEYNIKSDINHFLTLPREVQKSYLIKQGISFDMLRGIYYEDNNVVVIQNHKNPFTRKTLRANFINNDSTNCVKNATVIFGRIKINEYANKWEEVFLFYQDELSVYYTEAFQSDNKKDKRNAKNVHAQNKRKLTDEERKKRTEEKKLIQKLREESKKINSMYNDFIEGIPVQRKDEFEIEQKNRMIQQEQRKQRIKDEHERQRTQELAKIGSIIDKRKITKLIHITDIENLNGILNEGIRPRDQLEEEKRPFVYYDEGRFDHKKNTVSLSIEQPNKEYFNIWNVKSDDLVCIVIRPDILLDNQIKYYCQHNAATRSISEGTCSGRLTKSTDFEAMFDNKICFKKAMSNGYSHIIRQYKLKPCYTTSVQAEILYQGTISLESIIEIITINDAKCNIVKKIFCNTNILVRADYDFLTYLNK